MSMVRCEECERLIDSDDDPECFEELRYGMNYRLAATIVRCDNCRQNQAERAWERQQEGEPPTTQAERYQAAWHEHQKAHRR